MQILSQYNFMSNKIIKLALFASGNGSNVQQIAEYFQGRSKDTDTLIEVDCVVYNRKDAFVATRAQNLGLPAYYMNKGDFFESNAVLDLMKEREIDYIILAGFLLLVPENLIHRYRSHIINIHPALLPKYGGKGMYGIHVHEAVVENKEKETGITIHLVDEQFDHGEYLFQARCDVLPTDSADDVAAKVHLLEKEFFPKVIEQYILEEE